MLCLVRYCYRDWQLCLPPSDVNISWDLAPSLSLPQAWALLLWDEKVPNVFMFLMLRNFRVISRCTSTGWRRNSQEMIRRAITASSSHPPLVQRSGMMVILEQFYVILWRSVIRVHEEKIAPLPEQTPSLPRGTELDKSHLSQILMAPCKSVVQNYYFQFQGKVLSNRPNYPLKFFIRYFAKLASFQMHINR